MTTNRPEVVMTILGGFQLVRLSDYETLQAECEKLRKDAAFYRRLRSLTYEQLGQHGVPCVAVPETDNRGFYVSGEDLDAAMETTK